MALDPLAAIRQFESGGGRNPAGANIPQGVVGPQGGFNPSTGTITGPSTAGGYYQITNSTWRSIPSSITQGYPTAISAPYDVQTAAAAHLYNTQGFGPWAPYNSNLRGAIANAGGPGAYVQPGSYDPSAFNQDGSPNTSGQTVDMSGFGTQPIQDFSPNLPTTSTQPDTPVTGDTKVPTQSPDIPITGDTGQTPVFDPSGNQIGTETPVPPDFSTLQNFGAVDPTAGSAFGGAFDSSGNVIAGSSGDIGGMGLPSGLFAGGSGGGGLGYQVQPGNVQAGNEAVTGQPTPVPDVANAISNVGKGINTTLGAAGTAVSKGILGGVADAVTSAENWAGNLFARGGVMVLAVVLALIGGYLLYQRSSGGGRTAIIPA